MNGKPPELRLKFLADKIGSGKTPLGGAQAYVPTGVMFLRSQNVHFDGLRLDDVVFIDEDTDAEMASTRVEPEDVLLNITGASLGRCALVPVASQRANVSQHVCIIRPNTRNVLPSYLNNVLQSAIVQSQIFSGENGSSREGLTFEQIGNLAIPLPGLARQRAVADYLACETARLDALVAAKERVLGLLTEKRRAIITRAVTRGLDPRAPLRNSGITWLGEIPAHWRTLMLRYACAAIQTGGTPSTDLIDETDTSGVDWFTPGDFQENLELRQSVRKVAAAAVGAGELRLFPAGTVFVVGIGATLGKTGFITQPASANQQINALVPARHTDSRYLAYLLTLLGDVMNISANSATLPILNQQRMGQITVTLPPLEEQRAIVRWIEERVSHIDEVRRATDTTIELLHERRSALIAAAVTGQLEVA